jgi:ADP-ribose pyrophosphatase
MSACKIHIKCRNSTYARDATIVRANVPDDKVNWNVPFPEYKPLEFTHSNVLKKPVWADVDIEPNATDSKGIEFNKIDKNIDRRSFMGDYQIVHGRPLNPMGRTGISGRGLLGRWGPNHAADPVVTRWKRNENGEIIKDTKSEKQILQFVSILRGDVKEWAIPGGMVDPGEDVSLTLKREFSEEAMNFISSDAVGKKAIQDKVNDNFNHGKDVYKGYVDDPRNTDNSWMETVARNFHDENGDGLGKFQLTAGDDAVGVKWTDVSESLNLYASHRDFVEVVAKLHNAHW